jgi:hypothetical protein
MDCTHAKIVSVSEYFYGNSFAPFQSFVLQRKPSLKRGKMSYLQAEAVPQLKHFFPSASLHFKRFPKSTFGRVRGWHVKDIPSQASASSQTSAASWMCRDVLYRRHANFLFVTNCNVKKIDCL